MRASFLLATFLSFSTLAGGSFPARAQDQDADDGAATEAAPAAPNIAPDKPPSLAERNAERQMQRRAQNELRLRAMMTDFGIEAAGPQDALIAYLAEDEAGKSAVRGAARRLMLAVRQGETPARLRELMAVYKAAIDADKERRRAAQNVLDAKVGFSLSPRLEATLWLLGVLGEGQNTVSFSSLRPRTLKNTPGELRREPQRDPNRARLREAPTQRGGLVRGVVVRKAEGWIEVKSEAGAERYAPFWAGGDTHLDPLTGAPLSKDEFERLNRAILQTLAQVKIGERVRLDWVWDERKRVARIEILPPAPNITEIAPAYPAPTPRADRP